MSIKSAFERQLSPAMLSIGFSIKIPDCTRARKPFDYVVGIPKGNIIKFVAVEAKRATGWSLHRSKWESHQRAALTIVHEMSPNAPWVAIGFLDMPKMKMGPDRKKLKERMKKEAYLIRWCDFLAIESENSAKYADIATLYPHCKLSWGKIGGRANSSWIVPENHPILF